MVMHFVLFSVTGFPVWVSIVSIGIVCTFYTTIVSNCFCFVFLLQGPHSDLYLFTNWFSQQVFKRFHLMLRTNIIILS